MTSGPNERLIYFTAGASLVFMMYSVVRHATTLFATEPEEPRNILGMVEDSTLLLLLVQDVVISNTETAFY